MKKISTLFIINLLILITGNCQKNLEPGYIVNNNNDTITGFVDYREWYKNPVSILFTQSKDIPTQKFMTHDIISFNVIGKEQYRRYKVNISMNKDMIGDMGEKDTTQRTDTVFLKVLHEGINVQFFSYIDDMKSRLYVLSPDENMPLELKNTEYLSNGQVISEKEYRYILLAIAKKYVPEKTELQSKIYAAGFYKNDILDICYEIDGVRKDNVKAETKKEKQNPLRFWAGIGLNRAEIKIDGDNRYTGKTSGATFSPLFATGMDILINPYIGKMFLRTEVSYSTYKTDAYIFKEYFASKENYYFKFKQGNIAVHEMLNYNLFNGKSFKYFIGAGIGFNFSSYPLNEETFIREATTDTTINVNENYIAYIKKFWLNGIIKTGVSIRNIELSIAYITKSNISNYVSYGVNNSSLRLQLNYLLKN